jgi:hypothetical protein
MTSWQQLPASVRSAVAAHVGTVARVEQIADGDNHDFAAVLQSSRGGVFVKAVQGVSKQMKMLRNEITAGSCAGRLAPAVRFSADVVADVPWLVVGFDVVDGRPADLSPGSTDLAVVADTVNRIGERDATGLRPVRDRWSVDWWHQLADESPSTVAGWDVDELARLAASVPERVDGDRLAHTDLHPDQFRIGTDGVRVIDWGFPGAAAPWLDPAFLVLRLAEAGHDPAEAETWARAELAGLAGVDDDTLTAFAAYLAGMWSMWAVGDPSPGALHRARLARDYAAWRVTGLIPVGR